MAGRGVGRPVWLKQAEDAKVKEEQQKAAAARAAFEATFKGQEPDPSAYSSDSEAEEAPKPIGPVDPAKCTAAGTGVGGGAAGAAASFVVITKDSDGRRIPHGGLPIKVKITPAAGSLGMEQEALVKDHGDGTYTATYAVAKRGNYMVSVACNGHPISGSPFPVFFSGGGGIPVSGMSSSGFVNAGISQSFPNMMNGVAGQGLMMPGVFSGMLGMIPGILPGANGGAVLPGLGAAFGEVCREYLNGRCAKNDCKYNHPPYNQLMAALSAGSSMGALSQMPMGPSAAAMAAAQTIVAAQALQAAHAQSTAQSAGLKGEGDSSTASKEKDKSDVLSRTLQVSNLSPLLASEQLQQLFSYCGTVIDFRVADSKQLAYVEYAKPEEAKAALSLNNMEVGGRSLNVEMVKVLPPNQAPSVSSAATSANQTPPLPVMMQQAVAMQQLQFQQALMMQQAMASQQAASRASTVKSAAEAAAIRAAEISKSLKGDGDGKEDKDKDPRRRTRSRSRSRSPIRYHHSRRHRSRSISPIRYRREHRPRSRSRDRYRHRSHSRDRKNHYRDSRDSYRGHHGMREREREGDRYSRSLRSRSRSWSRSRTKRSSRALSGSPKYRKERNRSREVKKEDHKSVRRTRRSRSISKDSIGSLENDLSDSSMQRKDKIGTRDSVRKDAKDGKERIRSQEVKRDDHKSSRHSRRSRSISISKDLREASLETDLSISPVERRNRVEAGVTVRTDSKDIKEAIDNRGVGKAEICRKDLGNSEKSQGSMVMEKHNDWEKVTRENLEDECDKNLSKSFSGKAVRMEGGLICEDTKQDRNARKQSNAVEINFFSEDGELQDKSNDNVKQRRVDNDSKESHKENRQQRKETEVDAERKLRENKRQGKEMGADDERGENKLHKKERKFLDDEEEEFKEKKRYKREREVDDKKERKRHRKRNRKEEDSEKSDRKKRKHKHRRSISDSAESSPLIDIDKDDLLLKAGSTQQEGKHRGVDIDKDDLFLKRGSTQQEGKHRGVSKSISPNLSSQD